MKKLLSGLIMVTLLLAAVACVPKQVQKNHTVTFMNGETVFATEEFKDGETINFSLLTFAQGNPEKSEDEGSFYTFSGWSETEGGEKLSSFAVTQDLTVYAIFETHEKQKVEDEGLLTVTFVGKDDTGEIVILTEKVKAGEIAPQPQEIPAPTGYRFTGWDRDLSQPIQTRTQFVAAYEKCSYHLVRHILGETQDEEILFESELDILDPVPQTGLIFEGWYQEKEFINAADVETMPAGDLHLYAKYSVDLKSAHLSVPDNLIYGNQNLVRVEGLISAENLSYTFQWQDGSDQRSLKLNSAGEKALSVKITANYSAGEGSFSSEKILERTVSVAKRPLSITLTAEDITYGEAPVILPEYDGLAEDADSAQIPLSFLFFNESNEEQTTFPAGHYRVEGRVDPQENYEITAIHFAEFTVNKKEVTVTVTCENHTYGSLAQFAIGYAGFLDGENEDCVTVEENFVNVMREDETVSPERLQVGDYTLSPRLEAFSAQNYSFSAGESSAFSVAKAPLPLEIIMDKRELVYGEQPQCSIQRGELFHDETEEEVFGAPLSIVFTGENPFHVGAYEAKIEWTHESENYEVTTSPISFTVAQKQVIISLTDGSTVFGEELSLPTPQIEGLLESEQNLKQQIEEALTLQLLSGDQVETQSRFLRAGEYVLRPIFSGELSDYAVSCTDAHYQIHQRSFPINSGEVSQNRSMHWSFTPVFSGGEEELFHAEGLLVLDTNDAGSYVAHNEEELSRNHFVWQTPLKIMLSDNTDVTSSFAVSYDLNITLNNSRFSITLPFTQKTVVYSNQEIEYPITVKTEDGDNESFTVRYKVNGTPVEIPKIKNAGEYEIECEISALNYETETKNYHLTVEKANFTFSGLTDDRELSYNGQEQAAKPTLVGVGDEDVSQNLSLSVEYTPILGDKTTSPQWIPVKEAGEYRIALTASGNANYNDLSKNYTLKITRISYQVEAPNREYEYDPNSTYQENIKVQAIEGNQVSVQYDLDGSLTNMAPSFHDAVPEGKTVKYKVFESNNYEEASGEYKVTVRKKRGQLYLSDINKYYIYNGQQQIVNSGATSNNPEDGVIIYEHNTFTTVAEGNALSVIVKLEEGKNYTGAEETVTGFHVDKQTFQSLPMDKPTISEQYNTAQKHLRDVAPPQDFSWKSGDETLVLGPHEYDAIYNPDSENCNDFPTKLQFNTRKERVQVNFQGLEGEIGTSDIPLASYSLTGEDGKAFETPGELLTFQANGTVDFSRGGTYPVTCELSVQENNFFEISNDRAAVVPFKLKSVEYDETLYTVEDALHVAESGMITIKKNTSMMSKADRALLTVDPYADESFRTVKNGVKLLVPYKEGDNGTTTQNKSQVQSAVTGEGYCNLKIPEGIELRVEGEFIVNALRSSDGQRTSMVVGSDFATLELCEGATVRVAGGGVFESMGFTFGKGEVYAEQDSKIFEPFSMVGWKGGSISSAVRNDVFPINQYTLASLESKTHFAVGSNYVLRASLSATLSFSEQHLDLEVGFLGKDTAFLELKSGEITKELSDGKVLFEVKGNMTFHNLELKLNNSIKFDTSGIQVPIPGNISITLKEGSTASIPDNVSLKLLPGANALIEKGATLNIEEGGALLSYGDGNASFTTVTEWRDGGNKMQYPHAALPQAYRKQPTFSYKASTPATVRVLGTLDAKSGSTVAAELTTEDEGTVSATEAKKEITLKEDNTPTITGLAEKLKALQGQGGTFFEATLRGKLNGEDL